MAGAPFRSSCAVVAWFQNSVKWADSPVLAGSNSHSWSAKAQLRHWSNRVVSRNVRAVRFPVLAADQVEQVVHPQGDLEVIAVECVLFQIEAEPEKGL